MTEFPLQCHNCGQTGSVGRVTAGLLCGRCGSNDLDLFDGKTAERRAYPFSTVTDADEADEESGIGARSLGFTHARRGLEPQKPKDLEYMTGYRSGTRKSGAAHGPGTGWELDRPDPRANWDEYAGPTPGYNPNITNKEDANDSHICPVCHGTGTNPRGSGGGYDEPICRYCDGKGRLEYNTENENPSLDAHVPNGPQLGGGQHGHYTSSVGNTTGNTTITFVPTTTGSMGWVSGGQYVAIPTAGNPQVVAKSKADKIVAMSAKIVETNPGLTTGEAFELARRAVEKFPEN